MTNEELVVLAKSGDMEAYNLLFEQNKGFVCYVASRWKNTRWEYDDLVQLAFLGMLKAYRSFDTDKGVKFLTFASTCMNNQIKMSMQRKQFNLVHMDGIHNSKSDEEDTWEMPYVENRFEEIETLSMIQDMMDTLLPKFKHNKRVVLQDLLIGNLDQPTVAMKLGITQPCVSRMAKQIKEDFRKLAKRRGCL